MSAPRCEYCGDVAPYGDARFNWMRRHSSWGHRLWHWLKR